MTNTEDMSDLFGVLNINKAAGCTSRDVVNTIQKLVRPVKCGHAGTLDPMATGVLLVCIGPATRLTTLVQESSKTYVSEFTLGLTSSTDDSTGMILSQAHPSFRLTVDEIQRALSQMTGPILQTPPAYSAVHVNGQRAYKLARQGESFDLTPRIVQIHSIRVLSFEWPRLELEIDCGSGTYIRSIARDLGTVLGCGGLMSRLERTRIGSFSVSKAVSVEDLTRDGIASLMCPAIDLVRDFERYPCSDADLFELRHGRVIRPPAKDADRCRTARQRPVALIHEPSDSLLALAEWTSEHTLQPRTVFRPSWLDRTLRSTPSPPPDQTISEPSSH
ncbi:MAG: tRNA pseudouridine(55) synthase TruB [Planctomycetota bacterium]